MCEAKVLALKTAPVQRLGKANTFLISRANGNTSINGRSRQGPPSSVTRASCPNCLCSWNSPRPDLLPLKVAVCGFTRPADLVQLPGATSQGCKCPKPGSESIKKQTSLGLKVNKHIRAAHLPVLKPEITSRENILALTMTSHRCYAKELQIQGRMFPRMD